MSEPSAATPASGASRSARRSSSPITSPSTSAASPRSATSSFDDPGEVDRLDHRAQRRRQDDVLQHADRAATGRPSGTISFEGKDITERRPDLITKLGIARTFQNIRLFATMTAIENVLDRPARADEGRHGRLDLPLAARSAARSRRCSTRRARCSTTSGLRHDVFDQLAINLSYGDQRRVEIARALASDPKLLLLDEPTAGMNPNESAALTEFIRKLRDERGLTVLLIEHDMKVVMGVSERDHGARPRREDRRGRAGRGARATRASSRPTSASASPRRTTAYDGSRDHAPRSRGHPHLLRQHPGAQGHLADRGGGRDRHADRLQRGRQVDDAALDLGAHAGAHAARSASRATDISNSAAAGDRRPRHRAVARGPHSASRA